MKNRGFGIYYLNTEDFAKAVAQADKDNGEIMKAAGIAK
jgi:tripartite-type tricarboxylate transporter receptor subunit TctC